MIISPRTAFVTLTDRGYFSKARTTIRDLRTYGRWEGVVVLIVVDFMPTHEEIANLGPNLVVFPVEHIDHTALWETWKKYPIRKQFDDVQYKKFYQWDKLYVFHPFFKSWRRVFFVDAGARISRPVAPLLELDFIGKLVAPDDSDPYDNGNRLAVQFDFKTNPDATSYFETVFGTDCLREKYFLNCFFLFDTDLIEGMTTFNKLKRYMITIPISCRNEMGIMNLHFHIERRVWSAMPQLTYDGTYNFGWNEHNYKERPSVDKFIVMKYPSRPLPVL